MGMPIIDPACATCDKAVGAILSSISMEESALAHILNAESEKLTAVINNPNATIKQILAANLSVKRTIHAIIQLESILQSKLELFHSVICE